MTTMRDDEGDRAPDARAVRVRLGPESAHLGLEAIVVSQGEDPDDRDVGILFEPAITTPDRVRRLHVVVDGWRFEIEVESELRAGLRAKATRGRREAGGDGPLEVRAIIPGAVLSVAVAAGDEVEAGQQLLVVEAMKMQNEIRAPRSGRIARVAVGPGQKLEVRDVLVVIEPI
jgi:biotin carboxyl carrier protein